MLDTRGRSVNIVMYIPLEYFIISYYTEYIMKCEQLPSPRASVRLQSIRRWRSGWKQFKFSYDGHCTRPHF